MSRQHYWVPHGQPARVAGHDIPGGLIYIGQHLRSAVGTIEPALINPALPIDRGTRLSTEILDPAPSYHLISPASRAAYLALADLANLPRPDDPDPPAVHDDGEWDLADIVIRPAVRRGTETGGSRA